MDSDATDPSPILVTGGSGFVGTNLVAKLLDDGHHVRVLDSLTRSGSASNLRWLRDTYGDAIEFTQGDVRDPDAVLRAMDGIDHVYHLAAQVAVTTSLRDPRSDFEVNAFGTLNVLEAARAQVTQPSIVFASTNKVYGALPLLEVRSAGTRYVPLDEHARMSGVGEATQLDFHGPYGCSKGAADQYVLDYARSFGLRAVVLRMSCVYGPHQHGNEDQGWVAHFARRVIAGEPLTIYGDGLQVRDVLHVEDLVAAFECARLSAGVLRGRAFNIGGGSANTVSVLELVDHLERIVGSRPRISHEPWRTGDQRYYVSDTSRFRSLVPWRPRTSVLDGLVALCAWLDRDALRYVPHRAAVSPAAMHARP